MLVCVGLAHPLTRKLTKLAPKLMRGLWFLEKIIVENY